MTTTQNFTTVDHFWIPLSDGTRLAARSWFPAVASDQPVGVVLEYIPYRTQDFTRDDDDAWGAGLASHGFAFVRVDIRGSGNSDGQLRDEFEAIHTDDLLEVIDWLSRQPWSNGNVGMRGYSWGGNTPLHAAVRRPAALKAIVACCASGDRFRTDLHWQGGALSLMNTHWAAYLKAVASLPPDPHIYGSGWREAWISRLQAVAPLAHHWTAHQSADDYWAINSPGLSYGDIECPVYAVGGQADGYVNEVVVILEKVTSPRKALIGPWGHTFPDCGVPGPVFDWLDEEVRWWRHWLNGEDTGIMEDPQLSTYTLVQSFSEAADHQDVRGRWTAIHDWATATRSEQWNLAQSGLTKQQGSTLTHAIRQEGVVGRSWREWGPGDASHDVPREQSDDDAHSLCFDGPPLEDGVVIIGRPSVRLRLSSDQPSAQVAARLCEVLPDGSSWPISFGVLNLAHRDGDSSQPEQVTPGSIVEAAISFRYVSRALRPGSRIRLALSTELWPMIVPAPVQPQLQVSEAGSSLELPVYIGPMGPIVGSTERRSPSAQTLCEESDSDRHARIVRITPLAHRPAGSTNISIGFADKFILETDRSRTPARHRWSVEVVNEIRHEDLLIRIESAATLIAEGDRFETTDSVAAFENGHLAFQQETSASIPRKHC